MRKASTYTPAPVFEHGRKAGVELQKAKGGGWLNKTLPKTQWGKKAEKDLQPRGQPAQLVPRDEAQRHRLIIGHRGNRKLSGSSKHGEESNTQTTSTDELDT